MNWLDAARACVPDPEDVLRPGFLTNAFHLIVGIERLLHLDQMDDLGFALLSGGRHCPSRHTVGGWRRHLGWQSVDAFCRRTSPWHLIRNGVALVRYDEHTIPRWTHKFRIPKGSVTTRNKHMHCEKLFSAFDLGSQRDLSVRATPGDRGRMGRSVPLVRQTLECGRPEYLHALFDAGAGQADAGVRALWNLVAEHHPQLDVTMRACPSWSTWTGPRTTTGSGAGPIAPRPNGCAGYSGSGGPRAGRSCSPGIRATGRTRSPGSAPATGTG
ncbi:MAG: hypothetical protein JWO38_1343 [Gemmataceae bacterium]|nr:hypothetical protein [Gemmataceae bacterium]